MSGQAGSSELKSGGGRGRHVNRRQITSESESVNITYYITIRGEVGSVNTENAILEGDVKRAREEFREDW
jgi:hypothetical protein